LVSRLSAAAQARNAGLDVTFSPAATMLMNHTAPDGKPAYGPQQSLLHPSHEREPAA